MTEREPLDLPTRPARSTAPGRGRQVALGAGVLVAMALAAAAGAAVAGGDDEPAAGAAPSSRPTGSSAPLPSPSPAPSTVPSPAASPSPSRAVSPAPAPASTDAQGRVVDGTDVGFLQGLAFRDGGNVVQLNRVTFLTGAEAEAEAQRRGVEVLDYLIVDDNALVRDYPLDPDAVVTLNIRLAPEASKDGSNDVPSSLAELRRQLERVEGSDEVPFELVVRDGVVVELHEVYLP